MQLIRARAVRAFAATALLTLSMTARAGQADRYALILNDGPLAARHDTLRRPRIMRAQALLKSMLADRGISVTGSTQALLNAVFVIAPASRVGELRALPGVAAVAPMRRLTRKLNKAIDLVDAPGAWTALGGAANAGAGMKIGVLDTGIDETHPGFQDPSLTMPAGYPMTGNASDATHATNKIIAVRSFVAELAIPNDTPEFSLPDDLSARDRVGHGTAIAMIAAGVSHASPIATISGVAPKAWLGNYKIFGSPGVNDTTTADVVLQALEAAFTDGMNVAILSLGDLPAEWGATDQGATCGLPSGSLCDPWVAAVTAATAGGMLVVVPSGNDGDLGWNTINTPGDVTSAITVGASTNAHVVASTVTAGSSQFQARLGDGPQLMSTLTAPLFAVASIDSTQHGCLGYPAMSLRGSIALLTVGECEYATKVLNAEIAGAVAVLIFNSPGAPLFSPTGLSNTGVPAALITADSGASLKSYLASNPGATVKLNPITVESASTGAGQVAYFSSRGPNIGDAGIKPDLVAPGQSIYTAAQNYDPNGDLYSSNRYIGVDGTSFAAAFAAGAAALVMQAHPGYSTPQVASALVNTANSSLTDFDSNGNPIPASAVAIGGGQLNVQAAVTSTVTVVPASVSFGVVTSGAAASTLSVTNTGSKTAALQLAVQQRDPDSNAAVQLSPSSLSLLPGQSGTVTMTLTGTPSPGFYEGTVSVNGGSVPLSLPYLYISASGSPSSLLPLLGRNFVTESGSTIDLSFRVLDEFSAPVTSMPIRFAPPDSVFVATPSTDGLGIAEAYMQTGTENGSQSFSADMIQNSGRVEFDGRTRLMPDIAADGVVDAASLQTPAGFAAGSYLTIFGTGLSEAYETSQTESLPLSLAGVSVSFDIPSANIHVPGSLYFVSSTQISVQIPWELAGTTPAAMKITLSNSESKTVRAGDINLGTYQSQLVMVPMAAYSPAFFEYTEASTGDLLAAALDENNALIGSANPVQRGHVVQFFMNGLGAVIAGTQPASGEPTPGTIPLAATQATPSVTIGGQSATVLFSGLAPLTVGLYQVNAIVPLVLSAGLQPVVATLGGVVSKATMLDVY